MSLRSKPGRIRGEPDQLEHVHALRLSLQYGAGRELFSDRDVRRALFHAIDRERSRSSSCRARSRSRTRRSTRQARTTTRGHRVDYDPDRAARMLDRAGWLPGRTASRTKNGERLRVHHAQPGGNRRPHRDRPGHPGAAEGRGGRSRLSDARERVVDAAWRSFDWEAVVSAWFLPADPSFTGLYRARVRTT